MHTRCTSAPTCTQWSQGVLDYNADEVDALFGKRQAHEHEVSLSMKTEFMSLWDGMDTDPNSKIVVMGATNRPQELDPAVLRRYVLASHMQCCLFHLSVHYQISSSCCAGNT